MPAIILHALGLGASASNGLCQARLRPTCVCWAHLECPPPAGVPVRDGGDGLLGRHGGHAGRPGLGPRPAAAEPRARPAPPPQPVGTPTAKRTRQLFLLSWTIISSVGHGCSQFVGFAFTHSETAGVPPRTGQRWAQRNSIPKGTYLEA